MRKGDKNCIFVFGGGGQLARCIKDVIRNSYGTHDFKFITHDEVDISNERQVEKYFDEMNESIAAVINCAAYTDVNNAEFETNVCTGVNVHGVRNLGRMCEKYKIPITHISTNYIYSGGQINPYLEDDWGLPLNKYGETKRDGDRALAEVCSNYLIVRTGWVYSPYGENFYTKIMKKLDENTPISLPVNYIGTPTSGHDLADFVIKITIENRRRRLDHSIFNFTNTGVCSWYDFGQMIAFYSRSLKRINPVVKRELAESEAARPQNSTLDMTRTLQFLGGRVKHWTEALAHMMYYYGHLEVPYYLP